MKRFSFGNQNKFLSSFLKQLFDQSEDDSDPYKSDTKEEGGFLNESDGFFFDIGVMLKLSKFLQLFLVSGSLVPETKSNTAI